MNKQEHLLTKLNEECLEVAKVVDKINCFGIDDVNILHLDGPTNRFRLVDELNDLKASIEMLEEAGIIPKDWESTYKKQQKKDKVNRLMWYARQNGALQLENADRAPDVTGIPSPN